MTGIGVCSETEICVNLPGDFECVCPNGNEISTSGECEGLLGTTGQ